MKNVKIITNNSELTLMSFLLIVIQNNIQMSAIA